MQSLTDLKTFRKRAYCLMGNGRAFTGWSTGKPRAPRQRFPTVKKTYAKPKSQANVAA